MLGFLFDEKWSQYKIPHKIVREPSPKDGLVRRRKSFRTTAHIQCRKYVESLSSETTQNFGKFKEDLIKTYTRRKPEAQRLRELNAARWDTKKRTLTEFAAILMAKIKKLNEDELENPDTDLFLKQ